MASHLRRTEDLQRLKTRELVYQYTDGTFPTQNAIAYVTDTQGTIGFSSATIDPSGSIVIPCALSAADGAFVVQCNGNTIIEESLMVGGPHTAVHTLDVSGPVYISGTSGASTTDFAVPGTYTIRVPYNVDVLKFEMIGAGGNNLGLGVGGTGGYISGSVNVAGFHGAALTVKVGASSGDICTSSTASSIALLPGGPLFVMAGAGGNSQYPGTPVNGGGGGGGVFVGGVAAGQDGRFGVTPGSQGRGGTAAGGGAGGTGGGGPFFPSGAAGAGRPGVEDYLEAAGGSGGSPSACGPAGGNGYTGGGQGGVNMSPGGGAGGGSSYVNTLYTTVTTSFAGSAVPVGTLPGYGRGGQGGFVRIIYESLPALTTEGDIACATTVTAHDFVAQGSATGNPISSVTVQNSAGATTVGMFSLDSNAVVPPLRGGIDIYACDTDGSGGTQTGLMRLRGFVANDLDICRVDISGGILGGPVPYITNVGATNDTILGYNYPPYAQVKVVGSAGVGRVYDTMNFPVVPIGVSGELPVLSGKPMGPYGINASYSAPFTGVYQVRITVECGPGASWVAGTIASFRVKVGASLYGNVRSTWTQAWNPVALLSDDRWHTMFLTAGDSVTGVDNSQGTFTSMGAGGGFAITIQPLIRTA